MTTFSNRWTPWLVGLAILNFVLGVLQILVGISGSSGVAVSVTGIACMGVAASVFAVVAQHNRTPLLSFDGDELHVVDAAEGWAYEATSFDATDLLAFDVREASGLGGSTYVLSVDASEDATREVEIPVPSISPDHREEFESLLEELARDGRRSPP